MKEICVISIAIVLTATVLIYKGAIHLILWGIGLYENS